MAVIAALTGCPKPKMRESSYREEYLTISSRRDLLSHCSDIILARVLGEEKSHSTWRSLRDPNLLLEARRVTVVVEDVLKGGSSVGNTVILCVTQTGGAPCYPLGSRQLFILRKRGDLLGPVSDDHWAGWTVVSKAGSNSGSATDPVGERVCRVLLDATPEDDVQLFGEMLEGINRFCGELDARSYAFDRNRQLLNFPANVASAACYTILTRYYYSADCINALLHRKDLSPEQARRISGWISLADRRLKSLRGGLSDPADLAWLDNSVKTRAAEKRELEILAVHFDRTIRNNAELALKRHF